jgi:hypothetical protein
MTAGMQRPRGKLMSIGIAGSELLAAADELLPRRTHHTAPPATRISTRTIGVIASPASTDGTTMAHRSGIVPTLNLVAATGRAATRPQPCATRFVVRH